MKGMIAEQKEMKFYEKAIRIIIFIMILPWLAVLSLTILLEKK